MFDVDDKRRCLVVEINTHDYVDIIRFAEGRMTYDEFEILTYLANDPINDQRRDEN